MSLRNVFKIRLEKFRKHVRILEKSVPDKLGSTAFGWDWRLVEIDFYESDCEFSEVVVALCV